MEGSEPAMIGKDIPQRLLRIPARLAQGERPIFGGMLGAGRQLERQSLRR